MSGTQKETAFLRRVIVYDDTGERHKLEEKITQAQRDEYCVRRAVRLMVFLIALALAGLGYAAVFLEDFTEPKSQFVLRLFGVLALGSLIALFAYLGLWFIYRQKLNRRHEECRQFVAKLLESRLGQPRKLAFPEVAEKKEGRRSYAVNNGINRMGNDA
jgi:uncharacterized membrane protein YccC